MWEWRRGDGHRDQPLLEFYVEQLVVYTTHWIFVRASKRGDTMTHQRMTALAMAAADYERES